MAFFDWEERFSVHNSIIDAQHKRLVSMLNNMYDAMADGQGEAVLGKTIDDLLSYTRTHFSAEERMLESTEYPDLEAHKKKHRLMTGKVEDFKNQFSAGTMKSAMKFSNFLKDWLMKHILETDMTYKPYLADK